MNGPNPEDSLTTALGELERLERDRAAHETQRAEALDQLERQADDIQVLRDRLMVERLKQQRLAEVIAREERREARLEEELAMMRENTRRARLKAEVRLKRVELELLEDENATDQRGWMALGLGGAVTALGLAIVSLMSPVGPGDANTFVDSETAALKAEVEEARHSMELTRATVQALELAHGHHEATVAQLEAEAEAEAEARVAMQAEPEANERESSKTRATKTRSSKSKGSKSKSSKSTSSSTSSAAPASTGRPDHEKIDLGSFGGAPLIGP